jgi:hypothetical protein
MPLATRCFSADFLIEPRRALAQLVPPTLSLGRHAEMLIKGRNCAQIESKRSAFRPISRTRLAEPPQKLRFLLEMPLSARLGVVGIINEQ